MDDVKKLKEALYDHCLEFATQRLTTVKEAMKEVRESANDENKSSAGDKHETGRSMAQLEQEKLSMQLQEAEKLMNSLLHIERGKLSTSVGPGSLVETSQGNYFISISAGKLTINNSIYYAVSPVAPVAAALAGQKKGSAFTFNGQQYRIKKVS